MMTVPVSLALVCVLVAGMPAVAQQQPAVPPGAAPAGAAMATPAASAPVTPALPNTLMDGTAVDAKAGQQVPFEVTEDVAVQGVTVIAKGTQALATVTSAEPKKRMGRGGKLDVNVDSTRLVDGEKVQLRAVKDTKGGGHVGAMTGAMVATGIVFFPAAPLFLLIHGKDITIPKGTEVTAFVQGDTKLNMAKMVPASGPAGPVAAAVVAQMTSLTVESPVRGADIEVDGNFMGSTPSTVSVTPGQHTITVKKKGFADWTKTMNVAGSGVRVNAAMEKAGS